MYKTAFLDASSTCSVCVCCFMNLVNHLHGFLTAWSWPRLGLILRCLASASSILPRPRPQSQSRENCLTHITGHFTGVLFVDSWMIGLTQSDAPRGLFSCYRHAASVNTRFVLLFGTQIRSFICYSITVLGRLWEYIQVYSCVFRYARHIVHLSLTCLKHVGHNWCNVARILICLMVSNFGGITNRFINRIWRFLSILHCRFDSLLAELHRAFSSLFMSFWQSTYDFWVN